MYMYVCVQEGGEGGREIRRECVFLSISFASPDYRTLTEYAICGKHVSLLRLTCVYPKPVPLCRNSMPGFKVSRVSACAWHMHTPALEPSYAYVEVANWPRYAN